MEKVIQQILEWLKKIQADIDRLKTQDRITVTGAALEIKEADGAPDVNNVTQIIVTNGKLTDNTGGSVSLDLTGTVTTPGGLDTQVQFNDGGSFGGDADFVWNKTSNILTVNGHIRSDVANVYNVKSAAYNATGNGIADDTTPIQNAIDDAHAAGGGTVYIPKGTYPCNTLAHYLDVLLLGDDPWLSVIQSRAAEPLIEHIGLSPAGLLGIHNIGLDGNNVGTIGYTIRGGLFFKQSRFEIKDFTTYGLFLQGSLIGECSNFDIVNCNIGIKIESYNFGFGIGLYQGNALRFTDNAVVDDCANLAMHITGSSQIVIDGGDFERNGTLGNAGTGTIYYQSPATGDNLGIKIINTWFENTKGGSGVFIDTPPTATIYNVIEDTLFSANIPNATYGIRIDGTTQVNKLICKRVEFFSNAATADFYADGANATIYQELCIGTTGGTGTFVNMLGGGGTVTGTGTNGKLTKWTGASSIGDATNTDADVSSAVSLKHTQGTDTALGALGTKNPPIDADKFIYRDSTSADALVTATGTQIKAYLKTYFDTLYGSAGEVLMADGITPPDPLTTEDETDWLYEG